MNAPILPTTPWGEVLARAARLLPAADPGALLFHEERADLRIELLDPAAEPILSPSRVHGAAARDGNGRLIHRSDPQPEDLARLASGICSDAGRLPRGTGRLECPVGSIPTPIDPAPAVASILDLAARIQRAGAGVVTHLSILWVEFHQTIWVANSGSSPVSDTRRGRRLKITASSNGWQRRATTTIERVLKADSETVTGDIPDALVRRLRQRLTAKRAPRGNHPIVFAPGTGGIALHELVGHALEGDTLLRGGSLLFELSRAQGRVGGELVTVIDDPRRGRAAWRSDDEGQQPGALALVREGRVVGAIHDSRSARTMKRAPTGHGRAASYAASVRPRMGCTFLAPGPHDPREVIESTRAGIHVRRMESAGTDPSTGTAYFRVTDADWIEDGRIDAPLEPFLLRAQLPEALASIDRVASDLEFDRCVGSCVRDGQALATSVGAPTFRLGMATIIR